MHLMEIQCIIATHATINAIQKQMAVQSLPRLSRYLCMHLMEIQCIIATHATIYAIQKQMAVQSLLRLSRYLCMHLMEIQCIIVYNAFTGPPPPHCSSSHPDNIPYLGIKLDAISSYTKIQNRICSIHRNY